MSFNLQPIIGAAGTVAASSFNFLTFRAGVASVVPLAGVIDTIPEEQHAIEVGVSQYPIETGATLTDHVFIKPKKLTITAYVSDLLVPVSSTLTTPYRDSEAWKKIVDQILKREVLTVVTLLTTYQNMILTGASAPKNSSNGRSLIVNMSFEESLIANSQSTQLPSDQLTGDATDKSGQINGGQKQSSDATGNQAKSWLTQIGNHK